jgi:hypothetical protein
MPQEIEWVHVRVRPLPGFELADVRAYAIAVGMEQFPTWENILSGRVPADRVADLRKAPGVGGVEVIEGEPAP